MKRVNNRHENLKRFGDRKDLKTSPTNEQTRMFMNERIPFRRDHHVRSCHTVAIRTSAATADSPHIRLLAPSMKALVDFSRRGYALLETGGRALQSPFLLVLRLYFFWQLFLTGKGKLGNIGKVAEYFTSLGIPLPTLNAYFIGSLECFGSLLLIIGLASRPVSLLIVMSMIVAYLTADFEAISSIFSDPDKFVKADPFPFLLTALIVLVYGPGRFSVDALLQSRTFAKRGRTADDPNRAPTGPSNAKV